MYLKYGNETILYRSISNIVKDYHLKYGRGEEPTKDKNKPLIIIFTSNNIIEIPCVGEREQNIIVDILLEKIEKNEPYTLEKIEAWTKEEK